jgi:hypothetical protein
MKAVLRLVFLMTLIMLVSDDAGLVQARRRGGGSVRYANRPLRKPEVYQHPQWMDDFAFFCDVWFDWFGWTEIPHSMRYSFVLTILLAPFWTCFFIYCCVHNDEYEDEEEERQFKERAALAYERKKKRIEMAKRIKFE